ncbi:MAG: ribbon-helix-helix protein, CopG family [Myxococcales bacterium]|nr:ribbon-helix-helix protein, CopG family [Myxococcales bacterium]
MKTAISIPDETFRRAERHAKRLGISRSELFTRAVERLLSEEQARDVRASYDRAFGVDDGSDTTAEFRRQAARQTLCEVEW